MINLHERMLPTSAGVEPTTSWSPVGRRIQLSHRGWPNLERGLVSRVIFFILQEKNMLRVLIKGASETLFTSTIGFHGELRKTFTFIYFLQCLR